MDTFDYNTPAAGYAHRVFVIRAFQLAATVAALYDHFLTLDGEIKFIWAKKWSTLKVLFLTNRYLAMAMLLANAVVFMSESISPHFCHIYTRVQAITAIIIVLIVQIIMQYRLYAIYERNRKLLICLMSLWLLQIAGIATILGMASSASIGATTFPPASLTPPFGPLGPVHSICTPLNIPHYFFALWLPIIAFEAVLVALATYKGFSHIVQFARYGDWWCPKMLTGVLVRDSILYFVINFAVYLGTALVWALLPEQWLELPEGLCVAITATMGARLVLNLREAYEQPPSTSTFVTTTQEGREVGVDIGWTPKTEGKAVSPMWPTKPLMQRMMKKGRVPGAVPGAGGGGGAAGAEIERMEDVEDGHGGRRRPQPPKSQRRRRGGGGRGLHSEIAFVSPAGGRQDRDQSSDEDEGGDNACAGANGPRGRGRIEPIRTILGKGELDDLEESPTTAVGSGRHVKPWRNSGSGKYGTSSLGTASIGSLASGSSRTMGTTASAGSVGQGMWTKKGSRHTHEDDGDEDGNRDEAEMRDVRDDDGGARTRWGGHAREETHVDGDEDADENRREEREGDPGGIREERKAWVSEETLGKR